MELKDKNNLMNEISNCSNEIRQAYICLDQVNDPDLIESCIYRIKSLECKHSALLKEYKRIV